MGKVVFVPVYGFSEIAVISVSPMKRPIAIKVMHLFWNGEAYIGMRFK